MEAITWEYLWLTRKNTVEKLSQHFSGERVLDSCHFQWGKSPVSSIQREVHTHARKHAHTHACRAAVRRKWEKEEHKHWRPYLLFALLSELNRPCWLICEWSLISSTLPLCFFLSTLCTIYHCHFLWPRCQLRMSYKDKRWGLYLDSNLSFLPKQFYQGLVWL